MVALLLAVAAATAVQDDNVGLNAVYERVAAAKASNSAAAIASQFDPAAILIDPRSTTAMRGSQLEAKIKPMTDHLGQDHVQVRVAYKIEQRAIFGDVAIDSGYMRAKFRATTGVRVPSDLVTHFLVTLRRQLDGSWKIVSDASVPVTEEAWTSASPVAGLKFDAD